MKQSNNISYLIFIAVVAALGGFLFGYDTAVISGTIEQVTKQFNLDALQQGWYVGCALVGSIAGVSVAGILSDYFGRKKAMLISAVLFTASGFGCALANGITELVIARIIGGVGIGVASIVCPLYISEVSPARQRGQLVSLYQLAVTVGFLGAYLVNFQLLNFANNSTITEPNLWNKIFVSEVWRGMLGMEGLPATLFFIIIFAIPESPRWLVLKNNTQKATKVLTRITGDSKETKKQIQATQQSLNQESASEWKLIFSPGIFKAVLIGAAIAILGQFMGVNAVLYYGPTIFTESGLSSGDSLFYQVLVGLVNVITTVLALFIIDRVGRKKLVYFGVTGMIITLLLIGAYFAFGTSLNISPVALLILFLLYIFCCAISICAVIFVLLSEMFPTKVRGLAMSIAGLSLWIGTFLIGQLTPWLLQTLMPTGTFLLFAAMCVPYILIIKFLVPETTGKTLEEIESYWTKTSKH